MIEISFLSLFYLVLSVSSTVASKNSAFQVTHTHLFGAIAEKQARIHSCPSCGLEMEGDHVSAMIIENRSTVGTGIHARQGILNRDSMQREAPGL